MILIRKATLNDAEPVATCLLLAMEDIVYLFMGDTDPAKASAFMLHFVQQENNQYSYQNCWVAEINGEVAAAVNVYDGARLDELRQPIAEYMRNNFDQVYDFGDETQAGEYYIDSLGVLTSRRGRGIGSKVLHYVVDEYANRQGKIVGLLVDKENPDARKLYLRMGFSVVGQKNLFGKNMEHLQFAVASASPVTAHAVSLKESRD